MTYYQQEVQRNNPYMRGMGQENQELRTRIESMCLQVQKFMLAMRRLQRAVNNKEREIQDLKTDFERNKKVLETMVRELRDKGEEEMGKKQTNLSMQ